jgi:hypothetical protein
MIKTNDDKKLHEELETIQESTLVSIGVVNLVNQRIKSLTKGFKAFWLEMSEIC